MNQWDFVSTGTTSNVLYWDNTSTSMWPTVAISAESGQSKAATAKPEEPIEWLRRRIAEVCWVPA